MRASGTTRSIGAFGGRLMAALAAAPGYPPNAGDLRTVTIAGLALPLRASLAIAIVTLVILADHHRMLVPAELFGAGRDPQTMRLVALQRVVLFGAVPLLAVVVLFRDRPARYGIRLGEWRWGLPLAVGGCAVMTPIVLAIADVPEFAAFYAPSSAGVGQVAVTNALDLVPAEFVFRGFLLFTLVRAIGPVGVLVATLPFAYSHLGKPEVETLSTLFGGMLYGWLDWRTGSIVWSAAAHVYILTLVVVAAAS